MTDREAMKLALGALELECTDANGNKVDLVTPAIKALRQALEQPEQEPVGYADQYDLDRPIDFWVSREPGKNTVPLYTAPEKNKCSQ